MFEGALNHGEYIDEYDNIHPDILQRYYGTGLASGQSRTQRTDQFHNSGIEEQVSAVQVNNIWNDPITPAEHRNPFGNADDAVGLFCKMLNDLGTAVPLGFGVHEDEWDENGRSGTRENTNERC